MFTDVVGSTAFTHGKEDVAREILSLHARRISTIIRRYDGQIIKSTGDGFLVVFFSALKAVQCAMEIQKGIFHINQQRRSNKRRLHRIGVHLGEVEFKNDGELFGSVVNIAKKIEAEANAGGIAFSKDVFDQVKGKISRRIGQVKKVKLKGIGEPFCVYRIGTPRSR
jgi:class 3 adenylate cyclase